MSRAFLGFITGLAVFEMVIGLAIVMRGMDFMKIWRSIKIHRAEGYYVIPKEIQINFHFRSCIPKMLRCNQQAEIKDR